MQNTTSTNEVAKIRTNEVHFNTTYPASIQLTNKLLLVYKRADLLFI